MQALLYVGFKDGSTVTQKRIGQVNKSQAKYASRALALHSISDLLYMHFVQQKQEAQYKASSEKIDCSQCLKYCIKLVSTRVLRKLKFHQNTKWGYLCRTQEQGLILELIHHQLYKLGN